MKTFIWTCAALLGLASGLWAQEAPRADSVSCLQRETLLDAPPNPDLDAFRFPRSIAEPLEGEEKGGQGPFSIGAIVGYLNAKNADNGTWFAGAQARLRFGLLAVEASIQFHQNEYENGDVTVTQYPVQLTAFLYILPNAAIRPYILGGVGWYYTQVDYSGVFSGIANDTQNIFGEHLGAGAEIMLGSRLSLNADVRYIFLNPSTDQVIDKDFNYWQITAGLNFFF